MITTRRLGIAAVVAAFCISTARLQAEDWPHWRGPHYDGKSAETGFKTTWGDAGPTILWKREIGSAYSSITCVSQRVYTCGTRAEKQVLFCLDAETGKVHWQQPFGDAYSDGQGDGTRATPTVDDGRVYILGAHGRWVCLDAETGKELWARSFGGKPRWGYSGSVLIQGDLAIASLGKADGALCAVNKKTGETVWKCGEDQAGYATPQPFTFKGTRYVCGFMGTSAIIAELETGKLVWRTRWKTDYDVNAAAPIYHDGYLFLSSGYDTGCALFKLGRDGDELTAREIWRSDVLLNKFQTPVLVDGKLYSSDQEGMKCVDFLTGKRLWRKRRAKHGTVLYADGHLIVLTQKGKLQMAKADPGEFKTSAEAEIVQGSRCWTVPTLSGGRLYARDFENIVCVDLRK